MTKKALDRSMICQGRMIRIKFSVAFDPRCHLEFTGMPVHLAEYQHIPGN